MQLNLLSVLRSPKGRDVLIYLMFCLVAFVFWVLLSLDTEVQRDYDVPVELQDLPDSVTLMGKLPASIQVSVKGKDSQLLRFKWTHPGAVRFKWSEESNENSLYITRTRLDTKLREYFGPGIRIVTFRPDSITMPFTTSAPRRLPLTVITDIHTNLQYTVSGPIRANVDSVNVYAVDAVPAELRNVETEVLFKTGLKDTMRYTLRVKPIKGMRIIPDKVVVTVPVEPLIQRKRTVPVQVQNVPEGSSVVTFPGKVDINYLVPMSKYNIDYPITAVADYNMRQPSGKMPVVAISRSENCRGTTVSPDSVEYIVETVDK